MKPGETDEERAENMDKLVEFLTTIVEVDLAHINGSSIVYKRDSVSANNLLELIFELIQILKQDQEENLDNSEKQSELPDEENNIKSSNYYEEPNDFDESDNFQTRNNLSCPQVEFENENDSNFKQNYSQNDLTRYEKVMTYLVNNQEELIHQEQNDGNQDYFDNMENRNDQIEQSKSVNISRISEVSRSKENSEPHSNNKLFKQIINTSKNQEKKSDSVTVKPLTTSVHKITSLEEDSQKYSSEVKQNYGTESRVSEDKFEEDDFAYENSHEVVDDISKSLHDESLPLNNQINNMNNTGKLSTKSAAQKRNMMNYSNKSSNRSDSRHRQKISISNSQNKKQPSNDFKRNPSATKLRNTNSNSFHSATMKKEESYITNHLVNTSANNNQEDRVLRKTKSVKQLLKQAPRRNSSFRDKSKDISMSSLQNMSNSRKSGNSLIDDLSDNMIEELPLNDENFKFEIMKEFRRIYGNKLDRILVKSNLQNSSNVLEMILRNVKLARQKMIKVQANNLDPDDLMVNL
jgi:hypothetical protein